MKRILIVPWHNSAHPERAAELQEAARRNVDSGLFDRLLYVTEEHRVPAGTEMVGVPHRPTYAEVFAIAADQAGPEDVVVIANSDIYFDDTLRALVPHEGQAFALARWEPSGLRDRQDSQDVWVFKGPPRVQGANFWFGVPGCDNSVLHLMAKAGYTVSNPSRSVKAHHLHASEYRTCSRPWTQSAKGTKESPPLPFRFCDPSFLEPVAKVGTKVLHIGFRRSVGCFTRAFKALGAHVESVYWQEEKDPEAAIIAAAKGGQHLVFMQLHQDGVLSSQVARRLTGVRVNWCGDVRVQRPAWFAPFSQAVDITAFSNMEDVKGLKGGRWLGDNVDYDVFYPGEKGPKGYDVVFMGNHYPRSGFPETGARLRMVQALRKRYGDRFGLFGSGWDASLQAENIFGDYARQAEVYRSAKVAVNQAHFRRTRYYSDRLFRAMACGAPCVSQAVRGVEEDFIPGTHLLEWEDLPQLFRACDTLIDNPSRAASIGAAGAREALFRHSTIARCRTLLDWAGVLSDRGEKAQDPTPLGDMPARGLPAPEHSPAAVIPLSARVARLRAMQRKRMTQVQGT